MKAAQEKSPAAQGRQEGGRRVSKENILKVSTELRKQGCKFVLSGVDEQKMPFFEFHGKTSEEAVLLHFNTIKYLCMQMLLGGANEQTLREYLDDAVKESFDTIQNSDEKNLSAFM